MEGDVWYQIIGNQDIYHFEKGSPAYANDLILRGGKAAVKYLFMSDVTL